MSAFQVDLRFPIKVYKEDPFVYTGPDFRSLPMGLISDTLNHEGRQYQRFYPFTVTRSTVGGAVEDVLFCFMFAYINDDDERGIYLTRPIPLSRSMPSSKRQNASPRISAALPWKLRSTLR